jgi:hypothetical protein
MMIVRVICRRCKDVDWWRIGADFDLAGLYHAGCGGRLAFSRTTRTIIPSTLHGVHAA